MKILLDTHAFLWAITDDPNLSATVRQAVLRATNHVFVSVVSSWEASIKYGLGKLRLPQPPNRYLSTQRSQAGFDLLVIDEPEVCQVHLLPMIHRDPFDRLLVAQANCHGMTLATNDPIFAQYPVQTIW